MAFDLRCDTCEFDASAETEEDAYRSAKQHESDYPAHFVFIYATE